MAIKIPIENRWTQPNSGDRFGSLWATKNINFDELGVAKLSPRTVKIMDEATNEDFGIPLSIGRFQEGGFQIVTSSNAAFNATITDQAFTFEENSGTGEPTLTTDSSGIFFHNRWFATLDQSVFSKGAADGSGATWTTGNITITTSVHHVTEVFDSRDTICIGNGNVVEQFTASGATLTASTDLTLPSDFEVTGLAYNAAKMGIITALNNSVASAQNKEAKFFIWNGATTSAQGGYGLGSDCGIAIVAYKSSYAIFTRKGELLYFNGGGFDLLGTLPFNFAKKIWSSPRPVYHADVMKVEGDKIIINLGNILNGFERNQQTQITNFPGGVWCFDPNVGFYHKYSPSISQIYRVQVNASGVNATTDVITAASGTIPATGNIVRFVNGTIGGLTVNEDYYVIKVSSSTFKLATSKINAIQGTAIDLTATNGSTAYFDMYDLVDYGCTNFEDAGAIEQMGYSNEIYTDLMIGGDFPSTSLVDNDALCMCVPFLENRGWLITPKIFSSEITDVNQKLYVKFRRLKDNDAIVVKAKFKEYDNLPITSPNNATTDELVWTGTREGYTTSDLSGAKAYFDAGGDLEIEFTAGAGGGQAVKITDIDESGGTYTLVFDEDVIGATGGGTLKSYFVIDNWEKLSIINTDSVANLNGIAEVNVDLKNKKFVQFKIELRGWETAIEEMELTQVSDKRQ